MVDRHMNTHTETKSKYFDGHGCLSQSEEREFMWAYDKDGVTRVFERCHQGVARGMDGGKFKRRLSEANVRDVSSRHSALVMPSLSCAHIHSLSSDWERRPCTSKYFDFVSMCVSFLLFCVICTLVLSFPRGLLTIITSFHTTFFNFQTQYNGKLFI